MSDEFYDLVGCSKAEDARVWTCRRYLDDCFEDDTETVPVYDVVCGYVVTDQHVEDVKDECPQCGLYRMKCTCECKFFFCNRRGSFTHKCPKA